MVKDSGATVRTDRLRPLNTPRPVRVETDERGRPVGVYLGDAETRRGGDAARGRREDTAGLPRVSPSPSLRVEEILDQWRIDDEWWRKEISRMYFHVALEGGQLITLFQDLITGRWYGQISATPLLDAGAGLATAAAFGASATPLAAVGSGAKPARRAG